MKLRLPLWFLVISHLTASAFAAENWPQFRGPSRNGLSDAKGTPVKWSETENVKWKTPVHGKAWSSPVIWDNQIWLTTATEDGKELFAVCVQRDTGKILHDVKLFDVPVPQYADRFNSYGSPTPVIEAGRVYVTFGSPGTACLDTKTAKVLWQRRDLPCNHYRGAGSSPIVHGGLLIMNFDGSDHQYVIALDKQTGKTVWQTKRSIDFQDLKPDGTIFREGDMRKGFSSPHIAVFDGKPILVSSASKATYAYNPADGKELWRVEDRKFHSGSVSPVSGLGLVFTCTGLAKGELWAVKPGGSGVVTDTHVVWKLNRNAPTRPSPLLVGELLFLVDDGGIATCLEAKTGAEVWRERVGGDYSASPVFAGGKIYFLNQQGKGTVIEAGRQFKVLGENTLEDGFMASPAVAGKALFLRTKTALYRVEQ
ncbi:MAG: PQQ-binding-like beta-propeller repeat protein [Verrucomicrobia bacterium]|nr:PQQ-binding-like beta-propeller repeat protein [Verrucomicrobiota bacterium]